jgi:tetratricopeptide (TPR) repeat protein
LEKTVNHTFYTMKKLFAILFIATAFMSQSFAQTDNDYKDLLTLFVADKFERCLMKAEGYTLDDKTKKDAVPFLFMSRCYYEMSKRDEFKVKYPNAFKDAMKSITKYASKDKEKAYYSEYEDFISDLRRDAIAEANSMFETEKYTKSKALYDQLTKLDNNDAGAFIMLSLNQAVLKAKKESEAALKSAQAILENKSASKGKEQLELLRDSLIGLGTMLHDAGKRDEAKTWMEYGQEYFKDDKEFALAYDTIVG